MGTPAYFLHFQVKVNIMFQVDRYTYRNEVDLLVTSLGNKGVPIQGPFFSEIICS